MLTKSINKSFYLLMSVTKTGITVKNDFDDLAFWRGIWRKVPNVDTVYFDAAIEDPGSLDLTRGSFKIGC